MMYSLRESDVCLRQVMLLRPGGIYTVRKHSVSPRFDYVKLVEFPMTKRELGRFHPRDYVSVSLVGIGILL